MLEQMKLCSDGFVPEVWQ